MKACQSLQAKAPRRNLPSKDVAVLCAAETQTCVSVNHYIYLKRERDSNFNHLGALCQCKSSTKKKKELLFVYSFKKLIENHAQISYGLGLRNLDGSDLTPHCHEESNH